MHTEFEMDQGKPNMSNFVQEFDDDEEDDQQFQSTLVTQSSNGSPNPTENGCDGSTPATTTSKKKRNLPGNPDPDAEVVALSPRTLMATNRYICEVCHKGFQRDQNLQLHRRGHNLPWKLKQRPTTQVKKRVYICPEPNCVHHDPSRALGDLTGIKKHFCRKHGEKKWKCDKCSKRYAVQSDWKAHTKICGTREYRCDCGTIFSRKDSFVTHRAFCDALTEENYKMNQNLAAATGGMLQNQAQELFSSSLMPASDSCTNTNTNTNSHNRMMNLSVSHHEMIDNPLISLNSHGAMISNNLDMLNPRMTTRACFSSIDNSSSQMPMIGSVYTSATALLQKAAEMGAKISDNSITPILLRGFTGYSTSTNTSGGIGSAQVQEASSSIAANGLYVAANSETLFDKNMDAGGDARPDGYINVDVSHQTTTAGLYDSSSSSHFMQSGNGNGNVGNLLERQVFLQGGGHEKMTLDFLGVEPAGATAAAHSISFGKKRSYEGNMVGLGRYSNAQQSLHNLHSEW
ncbi:unnamed protein product [Camellia sinensis]